MNPKWQDFSWNGIWINSVLSSPSLLALTWIAPLLPTDPSMNKPDNFWLVVKRISPHLSEKQRREGVSPFVVDGKIWNIDGLNNCIKAGQDHCTSQHSVTTFVVSSNGFQTPFSMLYHSSHNFKLFALTFFFNWWLEKNYFCLKEEIRRIFGFFFTIEWGRTRAVNLAQNTVYVLLDLLRFIYNDLWNT